MRSRLSPRGRRPVLRRADPGTARAQSSSRPPIRARAARQSIRPLARRPHQGGRELGPRRRDPAAGLRPGPRPPAHRGQLAHDHRALPLDRPARGRARRRGAGRARPVPHGRRRAAPPARPAARAPPPRHAGDPSASGMVVTLDALPPRQRDRCTEGGDCRVDLAARAPPGMVSARPADLSLPARRPTLELGFADASGRRPRSPRRARSPSRSGTSRRRSCRSRSRRCRRSRPASPARRLRRVPPDAGGSGQRQLRLGRAVGRTPASAQFRLLRKYLRTKSESSPTAAPSTRSPYPAGFDACPPPARRSRTRVARASPYS